MLGYPNKRTQRWNSFKNVVEKADDGVQQSYNRGSAISIKRQRRKDGAKRSGYQV